MAKESKNNNLLIIAIVGIVAIVALMIFMNKGATGRAFSSGTSSAFDSEGGAGGLERGSGAGLSDSVCCSVGSTNYPHGSSCNSITCTSGSARCWCDSDNRARCSC